MILVRLPAIAAASAVVLCAAPLLGAPPAGDARAQAAESFRQAQAAFERRDFSAAAAAFEAAAGFAPHPAALLSAAEAWDRAGEPSRAADDCDRARTLPGLSEAAASDHVDYGHDAAQCLDRLRSRVALLVLHGVGALAARMDDGAEQVLPVRRWVRPGHHTLVVIDLSSSQMQRRDLELRGGEERVIDLAAPTPTPTPTPTPSHALPTGTWIAFGVAAPAAVAYGVFGVMTLHAQSDFDASPTLDAKDTFYRDRALANVTFAVAAVAAATGVVLWLTSSPEDPPRIGLVAPGIVRF
ncbi:MAG TPA: hypothetical protein VIF09_08460 [Polyangiaceae bacterium]|jgi:hypothetical protein